VALKANSSFKNKFRYISVTDEASDFTFGKQLGFANAHHQIPPEKSGCGPRLGELPKIWGFTLNISATAGASDFKFCRPLTFAKSHHNITPRGKVGVSLGKVSFPKFWSFPIIFRRRLKLPTSNLARICSLPSTIIKSHAEEKEGIGLD